jgi:outer membrane protein OmpA-like peptidoglycan-associated protein
MKSLKFLLLSISIFSFSFAPAKIYCRSSPEEATIYVVVIGAFAIHKNAVKFTTQAIKQYPDAKYEFNPNRNLYYVSLLTTEDRDRAINEATNLREKSPYKDAWVYKGPAGEPVSDNATSRVTLPETSEDPADVTNPEAGKTVDPQPSTQNTSTADIKKFNFKLYRAIDKSPLEGEVTVINAENSRKIGTYKANVTVQIPASAVKTKKFIFVCNTFGYRKLQRELDFAGRMSDDITVDENRNIVIPFELVRLQKGDIAVMYNVYFFKDAAVMQPESQFEANSLLAMMKENPKAKIRIHGHTNGNASGKIISMGESKKFFSLSGTQEGFGTATELSKQRAEVIKEYLVSNGIAPDRMEVKGWGGKRSLYDKTSTQAKENVRVEIELVED